MSLLLSLQVLKQLDGMPNRERGQLLARLEGIAAAPAQQHPGVVAMSGGGASTFRVRQGDWRAVFSIVESGDVVVDRVAHRREVYR